MDYPFHDNDILVAACGRICLHRKKINISTVYPVRGWELRKSKDGIWLVYIDLEQRTLQTIDNASGTRLSPLS